MKREEILKKARRYAKKKHKEEFYDLVFLREVVECQIDFMNGYNAALRDVTKKIKSLR